MTAWFLLVFIVQSARFLLVFEQFNYTRKQQTGQPFLSCPVLFWELMQQPHAVPFFDSWRIWRNYSVFRGKNRRLSLLWATFKSELRNLYCLAHFLKMPPFGKQKSTCFQYRKQVLGELLGSGSGALPFSLFNPSANQDSRKQRKITLSQIRLFWRNYSRNLREFLPLHYLLFPTIYFAFLTSFLEPCPQQTVNIARPPRAVEVMERHKPVHRVAGKASAGEV